MKYLLDTHTALWLFNEHEKLSQTARDIISDKSNSLYISIVSAWEIAIKNSIGKLTEFDGGVSLFLTAVRNSPIELVPILPEQVEIIEKLPFIHKDPFDRLIVATAMTEQTTILTADENIRKYDIKWIW